MLAAVSGCRVVTVNPHIGTDTDGFKTFLVSGKRGVTVVVRGLGSTVAISFDNF